MRKSLSAPALCGSEASLGLVRRTPPMAVPVAAASLKKASSCAAGLASCVSGAGVFLGKDCQGFIPAVRAKQRADTVRTGAFLLPDMTLANVVNSNAMEYVVKEADEVLIEAGYGGIITGAECFERYGFQPLDAPSLKFSAAANDQNSELAACLVTPTMMEERNLGELVQDSVRKMVVQKELTVQLRYAEELQREKGEEARRRRRRPSEDLGEALLVEEEAARLLEASGGKAAWSIPAMAPMALSPSTKSLLSTLHDEEEHGARNTHMVCDGDYCWPEELDSYEFSAPDETLFAMEEHPPEMEDFPPACLTPPRRAVLDGIAGGREVQVGV